ncbi:hypothetical protein VTJ04DRAFT_744 [Mycothermus thermophilus]|uniref:uncharacterized protein n=1 Tax=Humicola insolens TaxID=85995 RepID=UPI003742BC50
MAEFLGSPEAVPAPLRRKRASRRCPGLKTTLTSLNVMTDGTGPDRAVDKAVGAPDQKAFSPPKHVRAAKLIDQIGAWGV